jgi:hypothetical protein
MTTPELETLLAAIATALRERGIPTPYEAGAIARAVPVELAGVEVPYATAEDLILHKLFAGRARDIEDVRGIVARHSARLDWP